MTLTALATLLAALLVARAVLGALLLLLARAGAVVRARLAGLRSTCGSGLAREETNAVDGTGSAGVRG